MELCSYLWMKYILKTMYHLFSSGFAVKWSQIGKNKITQKRRQTNYHYFEAEIFDKIHKKQLWVFYNIAVIYWSVFITSNNHFRTTLHRRIRNFSVFDFNDSNCYLWSGNTILMLKSLKFIIKYNILSPFLAEFIGNSRST